MMPWGKNTGSRTAQLNTPTLSKGSGRLSSYAQKLVTSKLGGVLKLLDPVLELNPLNDFRAVGLYR